MKAFIKENRKLHLLASRFSTFSAKELKQDRLKP